MAKQKKKLPVCTPDDIAFELAKLRRHRKVDQEFISQYLLGFVKPKRKPDHLNKRDQIDTAQCPHCKTMVDVKDPETFTWMNVVAGTCVKCSWPFAVVHDLGKDGATNKECLYSLLAFHNDVLGWELE